MGVQVTCSHRTEKPHEGEVKTVAGFKYDNKVVKVDQCSETFYTVCFEPEKCKIDSAADKTLHDICAQISLASSKAAVVDFRHMDSGILIVLFNPMIKTVDFNLQQALVSLADFISSYRNYQTSYCSDLIRERAAPMMDAAISCYNGAKK